MISGPHRGVFLHHHHFDFPSDPLLLLQPVGDGPAHHPASHDHYVGSLRREVRVDLQGAPAAPRQRVSSLLPHSCQLGFQISFTKRQTLLLFITVRQIFTHHQQLHIFSETLDTNLQFGTYNNSHITKYV